MPPKKAKRIALLLEQQYQELEVWYPYYRLMEEGFEVVRVAPRKGQSYPSKLGYPCESDAAVAQVKAAQFDALVVPGGWCPDFMRRDEGMIKFVQDCAARQAMVLAAICHGGWMLCCTDALRGRRATSFIGIRYDMLNAGARWVDRQCVVDGRLITSRKPDDLPAFCAAIIQAMK
jgi:protease I